MKTVRISFCVLAAVICCSAGATTFYVPADGTLQQVIDRPDCLSGDQIEIAMGTYSGPGYLNVDFRDKDLVVRSVDPDDAAVVAGTVIDCAEVGRAFVFQGGQTSAAHVAGLTIVNGKGSLGGAVYINNWSTPTISRCVILNCAGTLGGAIGIANASPMIEKCQLGGNTASAGGGAVYISGGSAVFKNCIMNNNTAPRAGAIYSQNAGNPVISQCTITDNSGGSGGGAIWCYGGSNMIINGSIFWNNTATTGAEILVGGAGQASVVDLSYCNVQGLSSDVAIYNPSTLSGVGNIDVEPLFVEGNWRLSEESLCRDAGDPDYSVLASEIKRPSVTGEEVEADFYGNPRVWGTAVDIGAAEYFVEEAGEALEARVRLWPKVVNLSGKQNFLFCTIKIEGCESEQIDSDSILMEGLLEPVWTKKFKCVRELVVRFDMQEVAAMVMDDPSDTLVLTVTGSLLDGTPFAGSDTLKVYSRPRHPLGKDILKAKQMIQAKAAARAKQVIQTQAAQAKQNQACANSSKGNSTGK